MGRVSRQLLVAIMARRVPGPDDEINVILYILGDPIESAVDEGKGRIAVGGFGAIGTGGAFPTMASNTFFGRSVCFVELVGVEIY